MKTMSVGVVGGGVVGQATARYKTLNDIPGYRIGSDGTVWSCHIRKGKAGRNQLGKTWKLIKQHRTKTGYFFVNVKTITGWTSQTVHTLVLRAFTGERPIGMECLHGRRGPRVNSIDNLQWGTSKQNSDDMARDGTKQLGESNHQAKLTEEVVRQARIEHSKGLSINRLAKVYKVAFETMRRAIQGIQWKHV